MALGQFSYESFDDKLDLGDPSSLKTPSLSSSTASTADPRTSDQLGSLSLDMPNLTPAPATPTPPDATQAPAATQQLGIPSSEASAAPSVGTTSPSSTGALPAAYDQLKTFQSSVEALSSATDPQQQAVERDRLARSLFTSLQQDGHDVKWQGDTLMIDGRAYDLAGSGTASSALTANLPPVDPTSQPVNVPGTINTDYLTGPSTQSSAASGGDPLSILDQLTRGSGLPPTTDSLRRIEAELNRNGMSLVWNATGQTADVRLPDGRIVDVISGQARGGTGWQQLVGGGGAASSYSPTTRTLGQTSLQQAQPQTAAPRPTVDPNRSGSLDEAVSGLQAYAQQVLGRQLTQAELNDIAGQVGYAGSAGTAATPGGQPTPNLRPAGETGDANQALTYVQQEAQRMLGRPLTEAEIQEAIQISGYSGSGPVTAEQVNAVLTAIAQRAPATGGTPGTPGSAGSVTGSMYNQALSLIEGLQGAGGSGGPGGAHVPGTGAPAWNRGSSYNPGEVPIDDLEGFDVRDTLDRLGNTDFGAVDTDPATQALIQRLLEHPESLDPQMIETLKGKSADELAEMDTLNSEDLTRQANAYGIQDSNWLASERNAAKRGRQNALVSSNRDIDITAAETNQEDRRKAAAIGSAYGAQQRTLTVQEAAEKRQGVALANDTQLRAAAIRGDRYALREQINAKAAELGLQADELSLRYTLGQMDDLTRRYGLDLGAQIDREKLGQQSQEFQEDLQFKLAELQFKYDALAQDDAQFGADLGYKYTALGLGEEE